METLQEKSESLLIFETNIRLKKDVDIVARVIKTETRIKKWNIDQHDIDKVLRIESENLPATEVINLIKQAGYHCAELND